MIAATPAADSECPMLALTDPTGQKCSLVECRRNAWFKAAISRLSPMRVPVPCPST